MLPIIQPRPADRFFGDFKSQGLDQPKLGLQGDARPADRAGVGRDFWLVKNDMKGRLIVQEIVRLKMENVIDPTPTPETIGGVADQRCETVPLPSDTNLTTADDRLRPVATRSNFQLIPAGHRRKTIASAMDKHCSVARSTVGHGSILHKNMQHGA